MPELSADEQKKRVAEAALEIVSQLPGGSIIGVGTGSTANHFIDGLRDLATHIEGAVASSESSAARLQSVGIEVLDLNMTGDLPLYVDGADEANDALELIKGGGGALTREKIVAAASREFVCIVDHSKCVQKLGTFPLPIEVLPMGRSFVARQIVALGGDPELREDFMTDNNNYILDVYLPGVVTVGLFATRPADVLLTALADGQIVRRNR